MSTSRLRLLSRAILVTLLLPSLAPGGESVRATPPDHRLENLKDLDGLFPFHPPETLEAWNRRAPEVRRRILVANGLWPLPERPAIVATVHGKVEREGYSVERVYFESFPGLYVTGSLYRPSGMPSDARLPAILSPHGHWGGGRFHDHGEGGIRRELESGAEKFEVGGRHPLQARCVALARLGCIVFHYDMLGYADSVPISENLAHRFRQQRPHLSGPDRWGLYSAQSELRLISPMGLQTWNSLRALDWISSLPEVDRDRIGMTGASGGGTQTFILTAIDQRVRASFPAVMVSTAMQGGCTCENASYLRIGTGNVEFAALCAPRPLGLTAANDWTREMPTKGFPHLARHYALLGAGENLTGQYYPFGHNYNAVSRKLMLEFFNRHFELGHPEPVVERDYVPLSREELTVWTDEHPRPESSEEVEVKLLRAWDAASDRQIETLVPGNPRSLERYREIVGGAFETMLGDRKLPAGKDAAPLQIGQEARDGLEIWRGELIDVKREERVRYLRLRRTASPPTGAVAIWLTPEGHRGVIDRFGKIAPGPSSLLEKGVTVIAPDLLFQNSEIHGELPDGKTRRVANPREFAGYTLGYNDPLFARRVHDVLALVTEAREEVGPHGQVYLASSPGASHWSAAAGFLAGAAVDTRIFHLDDFRFSDVTDIRDPDFWPGAVKYGDLPALIGLNAPHTTILRGSGKTLGREDLDLSRRIFEASGAAGALHRETP